jgi:hypothetical protein
LRGAPSSDMSRFGTPWNYVVRDTLQFTKNIDEAIGYLNNSKRTCSIYLGVGSSVNNTFRITEYAHKYLNVYDDTNWHFDENHP